MNSGETADGCVGQARWTLGLKSDAVQDRGVLLDSSLSDNDFATVTRLIHEDTGILITAARKSMLVSRLSRRLRILGLTSFSDYVALLMGAHGVSERHALVSAVTTNVTSFFREPHHFKALGDMGHKLLARARSGARVRLWSAGCSTGQEAFSMAATVLSIAPDIVGYDFRILATDIDPVVIETARSGVYPRQSLGDQPPETIARFLKEGPAAGQVSVSRSLQDVIRFEVLNLLEPWPFSGQFDAIFCRNVVIYFDAETRLTLWSRFAEHLTVGGRLFVGHSERIDARLSPFFAPVGVTQYERTAQRFGGERRLNDGRTVEGRG